MKEIKELNIFTKTVLAIGLLFLIYGFLSRIIPIDFFWESKSIGWGLILLVAIKLLMNDIEKRKVNYKTTTLTKVGIGSICSVLLLRILFTILTYNMEAYKVSKDFIINNEELRSEVGKIKGFGLFPIASYLRRNDSKGETKTSTINLIIKGDRAYKSVTVIAFKGYEGDWKVYRTE